jgi:hypothetical protein
VHVTLNDVMLSRLNVFKASSQEDSLSLAGSLRFHYKCLVSLCGYLRFELLIISWEHVSLGEEIVSVREPFLHAHQMTSKAVFAG